MFEINFEPDLSNYIVIFVLGGPGAGKGTQCAKLVKHLGFAHYSAGDLLRAECKSGSEKGKQLSSMLANGEIVPSEVTIGLLKSAMQNTSGVKGFLIDGFPRNINQGQIFEKTVVPCKFVLFLDAPQEVMMDRLLKRASESEVVRSDDNEESIKKRFVTHYETCMPVIDYYEQQGKVVRIDATRDIDDVTQNVLRSCSEKLDNLAN